MRSSFFLIIMTGIICLTACGKQDDYETQSKSLFAMDTYMNITTYGENAESALNKAEEQIKELEKKWSVTNDNSEVYAVNHSGGSSVSVSKETADLLTFSLDISRITGGAFDPTIYPVLTAWGFTESEYRIPSETELISLLKNTGYEKVKLSGNYITIPNEMQIDFGAVGKE